MARSWKEAEHIVMNKGERINYRRHDIFMQEAWDRLYFAFKRVCSSLQLYSCRREHFSLR